MVEHLSEWWWALVLLGFVGGIVSGALGVGSGIVFIPILVLAFGLSQKASQGTALAVMVPMALLGALRYWRNPDIDVNMHLVALLVGGSLVGVLIGTEIAYHLPGHWLRKAFAVFMVVVAVRMFSMPAKPTGSKPPSPEQTQSSVESPDSEHRE